MTELEEKINVLLSDAYKAQTILLNIKRELLEIENDRNSSNKILEEYPNLGLDIDNLGIWIEFAEIFLKVLRARNEEKLLNIDNLLAEEYARKIENDPSNIYIKLLRFKMYSEMFSSQTDDEIMYTLESKLVNLPGNINKRTRDING